MGQNRSGSWFCRLLAMECEACTPPLPLVCCSCVDHTVGDSNRDIPSGTMATPFAMDGCGESHFVSARTQDPVADGCSLAACMAGIILITALGVSLVERADDCYCTFELCCLGSGKFSHPEVGLCSGRSTFLAFLDGMAVGFYFCRIVCPR